jgi:hypothetical protein
MSEDTTGILNGKKFHPYRKSLQNSQLKKGFVKPPCLGIGVFGLNTPRPPPPASEYLNQIHRRGMRFYTIISNAGSQKTDKKK